MKKQKGFTLIELLIVVAIIGIIAAIAIPSLLRARLNANEAAAIGDSRTISTSQVAYASSNGGHYGTLACLHAPANGMVCIPGYPPTAPNFIDTVLGQDGITKLGYVRSLQLPAASSGGGSVTAGFGSASYDAFAYLSIPAILQQTGVRSFGIDASGVPCAKNDGNVPAMVTAGVLNFTDCPAIR